MGKLMGSPSVVGNPDPHRTRRRAYLRGFAAVALLRRAALSEWWRRALGVLWDDDAIKQCERFIHDELLAGAGDAVREDTEVGDCALHSAAAALSKN